jgi:hypothetical protein
MKILKLKNSLLFLRIDPETDTVKCFFLFFISWNCFVSDSTTINLENITMDKVKKLYKVIADEWTIKYRIN